MWRNTKDRELRDRAAEVIPGGMYGHQSTAMMPEGFPQFFTGAKGTRITDADGNEYIDYMCAYGPNLLGYQQPDVMRAVAEQQGRIDASTGPSPLIVDLAEAMVGMISHADWAMFCKNGADATMMALMIARAYRDKRKVLVARNAYHGSMPWNTPRPAGVVAEDRAHLIYFDYNDTQSLADAAKQAGDDLAGIFAAPFRHDTFADQSLPDAEYARTARRIADEYDALLIVDDVRAGLRLCRDCSWETVGVRPDLSAWGKVLGNGQPISALVGNNRARAAASRIFVTGSFWFAAVPMAAAIETLRIVRESDYLERLTAIGEQFRAGLAAQAVEFGFGLRQTGPAATPMVLFEDDPDFRLGYGFCREAMTRGVYMSPYHNMFMNAAMTETDVAQTLEATGAAFEAIKKSRASLKPSPVLAALMEA
ncbi:aminotransferase class III-fold pyridoxal phosphate-dependent enzyme [Pseudooceanicola sp. 216_PA32_1]|uniref:Aminotransferase class III-fold pyridoxal phosphate-dependent enzyme n=1 Tax=Pseudooceanicola pacificus TaxID=2676438 RepID=A0A844WCN0_9RHOB|nr:aminotransferase class III-fold pyridoxal phosphate-dependent enzyme [Pseudooceanicola pacificus]MWB78788.1 aminotransferase class III-fold pyridoxal phosphate-dependent enzyme [Pseudooceanicola pacificus]